MTTQVWAPPQATKLQLSSAKRLQTVGMLAAPSSPRRPCPALPQHANNLWDMLISESI